ncbi:hypothetical protein CDAR_415511 [Caerostris darwini]|uniref:Uncharacterized protein n=1 Tax=Caerostris darwini TaxID=1538125 RepID=A0AAV4Q2L2_9ARAC|nr:hypothetical protein CDAR_415511 [Caerostris darwini]
MEGIRFTIPKDLSRIRLEKGSLWDGIKRLGVDTPGVALCGRRGWIMFAEKNSVCFKRNSAHADSEQVYSDVRANILVQEDTLNIDHRPQDVYIPQNKNPFL